MNQDKYLLIERDGYPAQIETLQTLNDASQQALTSIAAVCGSNTILKGCVDEVREGITYVTDGIMCIDGRIFQFKGGFKTQGVTVITEKVEDVYDTGDGSAKQMLPVRAFSYVTNSLTVLGHISWLSFVRVDDLKGLASKMNDIYPKLNDLYANRILKQGTVNHTFGQTISSTGNSHIQVLFNAPLSDLNYCVILNTSLLGYYGDASSVISCSTFNHEESGFRVKAERITTGVKIEFEISWIVIKK